MSNAIDDKELDDYLGGDTQYSRRYRAIAADAVPPELDSLVLGNIKAENVVAINTAFDKRTSTARHSKSLQFWIRLSVPVTLAASVVFSVAIMLEDGVRNNSAPASQQYEQDAAESRPAPKLESQYEQPAANAEPQTSASEKNLEKTTEKTPEKRREVVTTLQVPVTSATRTESTAKPASPSVGPAFAPTMQTGAETKKESIASVASPAPLQRSQAQKPTTPELEQITVTGQYARGVAQDAALPISVITSDELDKTGISSIDDLRSKAKSNPRKKAATDAKLAKQQREANPDEWLAHIRELRANGKKREANREWRNFVKAYPTHQVADDDIARAK